MSDDVERCRELVGKIYSRALGEIGGPTPGPRSEQERVVCEVERLCQECCSGASYEQYFRWSKGDDVRGIVDILDTVGQAKARSLTIEAIERVFGSVDDVPLDDDAYGEIVDAVDEYDDRLGELAKELEADTDATLLALGRYWELHGLTGE